MCARCDSNARHNNLIAIMSQMYNKKKFALFFVNKKKEMETNEQKKSNIQFHKSIIPEHVVKMNEI